MSSKAAESSGRFRLLPRPLRKNTAQLEGTKVCLKPPIMRDYRAWVTLRQENRAYLQPREPVWQPQELTREHFRWRVRNYAREARADSGYAFFIWNKQGDGLMGACNIGHVRRGAAQMAGLGYWIGEAFAGQGFMSEAVGLACAFGFTTLGLHRIEAACMVDNEASAQVLVKNNFREEGLARHYLKINGQWVDHRLFAACREDVIR